MNDSETVWESIRQRANELRQRALEKKEPSEEEKERIFKARAEKLSLRWDLESDSKERFTCITFQIRGEKYAISAFNITEIFKTDKISFIPCVPSCFAGMTNHRGKPLTVLDLANLFSLPEKAPVANTVKADKHIQREEHGRPENKIVVIEDSGLSAGVIVDTIDGLVELPLNQIKKVSSILAEKNSYISSEVLINNLQTHIIDVPQLLSSKNLVINQ